jgi:hypothetical protein
MTAGAPYWRATPRYRQHDRVSQPPPLTAVQRNAQALRDAGDSVAARRLLTQAIEAARPAYGEDHQEVLASALLLARLHREADDPAAARRVLEEALAAGERRWGDADPLMLAISFDLGAVAEELGNRHEARRNFTRVATAGPAVLGDDHWTVRSARDYLGEAPSASQSMVVADPPAPASPPVGAQPQVAPPVPAPITPAPLSVTPGTPALPITPPVAPAVPVTPPGASAPAGPAPMAPTLPPVASATSPGPSPITSAPPVPAFPQPGDPAAPYPAPPAGQVVPEGPAAPQPATASTSPAPASRGRAATVAAIAAAVAAVAAVVASALVVVAVLAGRPGPSRNPGGPTAGPTLAGKPPTDLRLRDETTTITITWVDPTGGTVPFIVAGGRAGQTLGAMATVNPGQTSYTVNGLNPRLDYCFTVLAVYSTDAYATSGQVCTTRAATPTPR